VKFSARPFGYDVVARGCPGRSVSRFNRGLCDVNVAINRLEVRQSPISEQYRPSFTAMVTPDPKQRNSMIYLGMCVCLCVLGGLVSPFYISSP
jgi:hypothetical protein